MRYTIPLALMAALGVSGLAFAENSARDTKADALPHAASAADRKVADDAAARGRREASERQEACEHAEARERDGHAEHRNAKECRHHD